VKFLGVQAISIAISSRGVLWFADVNNTLWQVVGNTPIKVDGICVIDIGIGYDDSIWVVQCNESCGGNLIYRSIDFGSTWQLVQGNGGSKIAVFNEIYAAVITNVGNIIITEADGCIKPNGTKIVASIN